MLLVWWPRRKLVARPTGERTLRVGEVAVWRRRADDGRPLPTWMAWIACMACSADGIGTNLAGNTDSHSFFPSFFLSFLSLSVSLFIPILLFGLEENFKFHTRRFSTRACVCLCGVGGVEESPPRNTHTHKTLCVVV